MQRWVTSNLLKASYQSDPTEPRESNPGHLIERPATHHLSQPDIAYITLSVDVECIVFTFSNVLVPRHSWLAYRENIYLTSFNNLFTNNF